MRIRIISSFRLADPNATEFMWEGNVDLGFSGHVAQTNERIYRYFNRVDDADAVRLGERAYFLPSLSPGDIVVWVGDEDAHSRMFLVDGLGFTAIMPGLGKIEGAA